ncbi:MAG: glycosyltransferase family 2 protein [Anaerolineae bacterium]|nr:glycosyltransferase family 2 protein [Anaerolineae bacterium]
MLDLAIIIVNYNTRALLRECLRSVYASQGDIAFEVCVVDNASTDDSAAMVRAEFPQARLIESSYNGGYAHANNLGLRSFGFTDSPSADSRPRAEELPRYVLLLNPDTVLPPNALAKMQVFMDARPDAGVVGPKLVRPNGSLDLACRRSFPTPEISLWRMLGLSKLFPRSRRFGRYNMTYLDPDQLTEVDSVVGAFMWVRREAILQVGLLDETFWMYGEDLDWAKRIKDAGWKVWYNPEVTVLHVKEAASRRSRRARIEFYRAMAIFYRKHYAASTPFWLHWLILGGIALKGGLDIGRRSLSGQWRDSTTSHTEVTT